MSLEHFNLGHYRAIEWSESEQKYTENPELGILVEVNVRDIQVTAHFTSDIAIRKSHLARYW